MGVTYQFRDGRRAHRRSSLMPTEGMDEIQQGDLGLYVQDQWTSAADAEPGLRYDYLNAYVPPQHCRRRAFRPGARLTGRLRAVLEGLSPRLSAAYDLFGNSKTAVKVSSAGMSASRARRVCPHSTTRCRPR